MRLEWSPVALDGLRFAVDYIEFDLDSPMAAEQFFESVIEKARLFAEAPGSETALRTISGIDTGYRYMAAGKPESRSRSSRCSRLTGPAEKETCAIVGAYPSRAL